MSCEGKSRVIRYATIEQPKLHAAQEAIKAELCMRNVLRCGRRFGKSTLLETIFGGFAARGERVGWFTPDYKLMRPTYVRLHKMLSPITVRSSSVDKFIETEGEGCVEFWTLDNEDAGRSRFYDHAVIDEAGLVKKGLRETVEQAIMPTLLDRNGTITLAGTPKGVDPDNYFYTVCQDKTLGYKEFHAPTAANPTLDASAVAALPHRYPPLVYQQEYLAEFVDWGGVAFFSREKLLCEGQPVPYPDGCDTVFAVIDSATKTGKTNDGTAVLYVAYRAHPIGGPKLILLDWDLSQVEGSLLTSWVPGVFRRLEELSGECRARMGSSGAWIEDKASGMVLNQHAVRHGWPARPIDSKLTALGKSERALTVSGYVHQDHVKISQHAFEKTVNYKGVVRNHLLTQVVGFRIGEKDMDEDDLLDTFCYAIALSLGNREGF
jgi:hypothetical protein